MFKIACSGWRWWRLLLSSSLRLPVRPDPEAKFIGSRGKYWAFQKVVQARDAGRYPIPGCGRRSTPSSWTALRAKKLSPSPPLDRMRLIRRVTFDLTGLPPTPAEVEAFLHDQSPRCLREGGGPAAGIAALRRALGARSGWTWCAMPIPTASNWTPTVRMPGAIATT